MGRRFRSLRPANDNQAPVSSRLSLVLVLTALVLAAASLAVLALSEGG